jgi:hypothetical protein
MGSQEGCNGSCCDRGSCRGTCCSRNGDGVNQAVCGRIPRAAAGASGVVAVVDAIRSLRLPIPNGKRCAPSRGRRATSPFSRGLPLRGG